MRIGTKRQFDVIDIRSPRITGRRYRHFADGRCRQRLAGRFDDTAAQAGFPKSVEVVRMTLAPVRAQQVKALGGDLLLPDREHFVRTAALIERRHQRSEEHTSELQSLMRISYAVFCLKKKNKYTDKRKHHSTQTY